MSKDPTRDYWCASLDYGEPPPRHDKPPLSPAPGYISESPLKHTGEAANLPPVLDAACGSRMFWFDRADARAVFVDKRRETHELPDVSSKGGSRKLVISPNIQADFTALPFAAETFWLVVFDPPHLVRNGRKSWLAKKYGKLKGDWKEELRRGFAECFRVLRPNGTLIFKWNEHEIPVARILALTPEKPLFGNRCGRTAKSHWIVFHKGAVAPATQEYNGSRSAAAPAFGGTSAALRGSLPARENTNDL